MVFSLAIAVIGILLARKFYVTSPEISDRLADQFAGPHRVLSNKYYVDEVYDATVISGTFAAGKGLWAFDRTVVDGVVNGSGWLTIVSALVLGPGGSLGRRRPRQPRRPDLRGRQLLVSQAADGSRAELRAVDALRHLRVREHLSVHAVI